MSIAYLLTPQLSIDCFELQYITRADMIAPPCLVYNLPNRNEPYTLPIYILSQNRATCYRTHDLSVHNHSCVFITCSAAYVHCPWLQLLKIAHYVCYKRNRGRRMSSPRKDKTIAALLYISLSAPRPCRESTTNHTAFTYRIVLPLLSSIDICWIVYILRTLCLTSTAAVTQPMTVACRMCRINTWVQTVHTDSQKVNTILMGTRCPHNVELYTTV